MKKSHMRRRFYLALIVVAAMASVSGCGPHGKEPAEKELVVRIGNYRMSTKDFQEETYLSGYGRRLPEDQARAKAQLLDEIIMRKLLVQEAQRHGFDRERSFMLEIERYWEQALLKQLFNMKMRELAASTRVSDEEVKKRYEETAMEEGGKIKSYEEMAPEIKRELFNKKIQSALDGWMADLINKGDVTVYRENLDKVRLER
ncbi:MAG: SurA N-terminal domain-containing protein [Candidatus Omnitrophica bacterium]|nr:SurA N-terminal domain-containing protein [Candidatus Omnitrophota bacterium]